MASRYDNVAMLKSKELSIYPSEKLCRNIFHHLIEVTFKSQAVLVGRTGNSDHCLPLPILYPYPELFMRTEERHERTYAEHDEAGIDYPDTRVLGNLKARVPRPPIAPVADYVILGHIRPARVGFQHDGFINWRVAFVYFYLNCWIDVLVALTLVKHHFSRCRISHRVRCEIERFDCAVYRRHINRLPWIKSDRFASSLGIVFRTDVQNDLSARVRYGSVA